MFSSQKLSSGKLATHAFGTWIVKRLQLRLDQVFFPGDLNFKPALSDPVTADAMLIVN